MLNVCSLLHGETSCGGVLCEATIQLIMDVSLTSLRGQLGRKDLH